MPIIHFEEDFFCPLGSIDFDNECPCSVRNAFWRQFSVQFAQVASGAVFYLADGEHINGTFSNTSFFSTAELPNLRDDSVTRLIVLLVHREGVGESLQILVAMCMKREKKLESRSLYRTIKLHDLIMPWMTSWRDKRLLQQFRLL